MSQDNAVPIIIAVGGAALSGLITAVGFMTWTRINFQHIRRDLSGIGSKVNRNEVNAARRYHNLTTAVMLAAPATKENEVSHLLKEEAS